MNLHFFADDDAELALRGRLLRLGQRGDFYLVAGARYARGWLVEAAGEDLRRLLAEVARVVLVVEAYAEDSLRVPVERAVDHFVIWDRLFFGERLGLGPAARVVPLGERLKLLLLYEREYLALGLEARAQAERRQRQ